MYRGKQIIAHQNAIINGIRNIKTKSILNIGRDITFLNIVGTLEVLGRFTIGRGCRFNVGKDATVKLGNCSSINPFTTVTIMHQLEIGQDCSISWNCQFLDEDFHTIEYPGRKENLSQGIFIGVRVWIGANVSLMKGTYIPNGCVIASNSVVKSKFEEENFLIAGNPAKIIKKNVSWGGNH
jgi:acetyltransferase-like isoleucine patch superfamily enzyme